MIKQQHFQYLVIGAGPAGIQMGYYLENSSRDYLILEGGESPGSFFGKFPKHRKLISINKIDTGYSNPEINLRHDWNSLLSDDYGKLLKSYSKEYFPSADNFLPYLKDFVRHYQIKIIRVEGGVATSPLSDDTEGAAFGVPDVRFSQGTSRTNLTPR